MARTPLMRQLQQLAHDHRLAGQRGIPVAAVREGRAAISRRQFLKVGTAGDPVKKGQVLLDIYSPELVATENELVDLLKMRDDGRAGFRGPGGRIP